MTIINFKGIRSLKVKFNDGITDISGENGSGKTTIFDAFTWVLFGKNGRDEKDFGVKTLDGNGNVIERLSHEVEIILNVNDTKVALKRVLTDKWTRRRGSETEEFTGNETTYFYDDVPVSATEYSAKIKAIIPDENLFKLLTSATYFNTLPWQKRREVLVAMAGNISSKDILDKMDKAQVKVMEAILTNGRTIEENKKALAAKKKTIKDELLQIPARIDEAKRAKPEPHDFDSIAKAIETYEINLAEIDTAITNQVQAHQKANTERQDVLNKVYDLRAQALKLESIVATKQSTERFQHEQKLAELRRTVDAGGSNIKVTEEHIKSHKNSIAEITASLEKFREKWNEVNESTIVFDENEFACPTCKRTFDYDTIESKKAELTDNFNKNKAKELEYLTLRGKEMNIQIAEHEAKATDLTNKIIGYTKSIKKYGEEIKELERLLAKEPTSPIIPEATELKKQADELELSALETPAIDVSELENKRNELRKQIEEGQKSLAAKSTTDTLNARIAELMKQESTMSAEIAGLEKYEFAMAGYERISMDEVEARVNDKFRFVRWKMFDKQINGGIVETCEATVNGVPYSDLNSAGRIQAGIDCINALSQHYKIFAPVWVDNRESVNSLPTVNSQLINLIVSNDKVLTIK